MRFFLSTLLWAISVRLASGANEHYPRGPYVDLGYERYVGVQNDTLGLNIFRG